MGKIKFQVIRVLSKTGGGGKNYITHLSFQTSLRNGAVCYKAQNVKDKKKPLSQIHVWVASLRIETGRYEMMPYDMRSFFTKVESEEHVLLECPLYKDILVNLEYYLIVLTLSVTMIKFSICCQTAVLLITVPKPDMRFEFNAENVCTNS